MAFRQQPPDDDESVDGFEGLLQAIGLLKAAANILRQRWNARTLLRCTCRPEEELFSRYVLYFIHGDSDDGLEEGRLHTVGEDALFLAGSYALVTMSVFAQAYPESPEVAISMPDMLQLFQQTCALLNHRRG